MIERAARNRRVENVAVRKLIWWGGYDVGTSKLPLQDSGLYVRAPTVTMPYRMTLRRFFEYSLSKLLLAVLESLI